MTLIEALVAVAIVGLLVGILLPAVQSAREAARRLQCESSIRQLGVGLSSYQSSVNCFPAVDLKTRSGPTARYDESAHYYSPLVRMLPELEQTALYNSVNFDLSPVDGASVAQNITAMRVGLALAICPSDDQPPVLGFGRVNYRFNLGPTHRWAPHNAFPGSFSGPFTVHTVYTPADFADGLSATIGASERLQGDWLNGPFKSGGDYLLGDFPLNEIIFPDQALSLCASLPATAKAESRGGESWFLSGFHFSCYSHCSTPNARDFDCALSVPFGELGRLHERVNLNGVFKASSYHRGGVNALLMDGSVRFVSDSIDLRVWRALATRSGGEVVEFGF